MTATRSDFEAIARCLAANRPEHLEAHVTRTQLTDVEEAWASLLIDLSLALKDANPRFNSDTFHAAAFGERPTEAFWWISNTAERRSRQAELESRPHNG